MKQFLLNTYNFNLTSNLTQIIKDEQNPEISNLIFDQTIFHPQGGGQPSDSGYIKIKDQKITIIDVKNQKGSDVILHQVKTNDLQNIEVPVQVQMIIDEQKRRLNARLHSGGHLLDIAVKNLNLQWQPGKGYHFPDSPYVEYIGEFDPKNLQTLIDQLNEQCKNLIEQISDEVIVSNFTKDEIQARHGNKFDDYFQHFDNIRFVQLHKNDDGCPCGGTHVQNLKEIKSITITKLQKKKKNVRVCYKLD